MPWNNKEEIKALLIDIYGVLYVCGGEDAIPIPGSIEAIKKLRENGYLIRLCSNVSTRSAREQCQRLKVLGFDVQEEEVYSLVPATVNYLKKYKDTLRPYLIVHPEVRCCFEEFDQSNPNCVLLGDSKGQFSFENLNQAARILLSHPEGQLISMGLGKIYNEIDGPIMDAGSFAKALEFACNREITVLGKPTAGFFQIALDSLVGLRANQVLMVGDDITLDVVGSQACGMKCILVRTGMYKPEDEGNAEVKPDGYSDDLLHLVNQLMGE